MTPITNCLKQKQFQWGSHQQQSFEQIKQLLTLALVLSIPNFDKPFQVETDTLTTRIGTVLTQEGKHVAYFNEKLSTTRQKWSVCEQELYAIVWALKQWKHYLLHREFILFRDHQLVQCMNSQRNISWIMQDRHSSYKSGGRCIESKAPFLDDSANQSATGFQTLKDLYSIDPDFVKA